MKNTKRVKMTYFEFASYVVSKGFGAEIIFFSDCKNEDTEEWTGAYYLSTERGKLTNFYLMIDYGGGGYIQTASLEDYKNGEEFSIYDQDIIINTILDYLQFDDFEFLIGVEIEEDYKKIRTYKIPVEWALYGTVEIKATSMREAIEEFKKTEDFISLPDGEYIDGSFKLANDNEEELMCMIKEV